MVKVKDSSAPVGDPQPGEYVAGGDQALRKKWHRNLLLCALKCYNCQFINPHWLKDERFYVNCPSGARYGFDSYFAGGRVETTRAIVEGEIQYPTERLTHVAYACTLCGSCEDVCHYLRDLRPAEVFEALRAKLVEDGVGPLPEHARLRNVPAAKNPYEEPHERRLALLPGFPAGGGGGGLVYFTGCTAAYRAPEVAKAVGKLLDRAGFDGWTTMGEDEWCCGSPLFRTGLWKEARQLMKHNLETLHEMRKERPDGSLTVVTACAGCARTFKRDYAHHGGDLSGLRVVHVTELLASKVPPVTVAGKKFGTEGGPLKFSDAGGLTVAYHDPCHLGRHLGVYDEPRALLKSVPGLDFREMFRSRFNSYCCGSGGGVKMASREGGSLDGFAGWVADGRVLEALEVFEGTRCTDPALEAEGRGEPPGPTRSKQMPVLVSACPFCRNHLSEAARRAGGKFEVMDITELLLKVGLEEVD
ncbi:MAG: (Fe-S)-binding protein [Promethearchaeota archaeon]